MKFLAWWRDISGSVLLGFVALTFNLLSLNAKNVYFKFMKNLMSFH